MADLILNIEGDGHVPRKLANLNGLVRIRNEMIKSWDLGWRRDVKLPTEVFRSFRRAIYLPKFTSRFLASA